MTNFVAVVYLTSLAVLAQTGSTMWNFDRDPNNRAPVGFTIDVGDWIVVADSTAPSAPNVIGQNARNSSPTFNVILSDRAIGKDVDIFVSMKSIAGSIDQGGGVLWRATDAKNYYIARYNPLENNYRVYKVVNGTRIQLGSAGISGTPGWHMLRVTRSDDHIECFYDGRK